MSDIRTSSETTALVFLGRVMGLAVSYFVAGRLALLLAIPPGYAAAVWPAAGIALAGLLLFGYRLWPAVFVGSFLVTASTSLEPESLASIAVAAAIAGGASLQAILGAWLVRRFAGFPSAFDSLGTIFGTMFLGGPLACLISPAIGVASLLLAGFIETGDFVRNWGTWWLGDSLGVLVIVPLVSAWGVELRGSSRRTRSFVTGPVLIGIAATVVLYLDTRAGEFQKAQTEFDRRCEIMARTLEQTVLAETEIIQAIVSFVEAEGDVDRAQFQAFVEPVFARHHDLHGLSWNAVVPGDRRVAFEEAARQGGYSEFRITERDTEGQLVQARDRDEHVVVFHIEPHEGNEDALGFDLSSDPVRAMALAEARDTGKIVATPPIHLVQETGDKPGFLFFAPIYRKGQPHHTTALRRRNLDSFVSGVFKAEQVVDEALSAFRGEGIDYSIVDTSDPEDPRPLYGDRVFDEESAPLPAGLAWSADLDIAGRRWTTRFRSTSDYASGAQWDRAWAVLTGGLFFTSLLGAFLLMAAGRASAAERANEKLRAEIAERRRAEAALSASEQQFRAVFENAAVGVAIVDSDGYPAISNTALQRMLGYSGEELAALKFAEFTHPEDVDKDVRLFGELVAGNRPYYEMEKRYITKGGKTVWGHLAVSLVRDPEGKPLFGVGMVQDITESKLAEETLRENQAQLLAAQRIASFASWEWDQGSDLTQLSREAYRIFGVEPEDDDENLGGFLERVHPDDSERVKQALEDALAGKKAYDVEYRIVRPGGAVRICHTVGEVRRSEDGSPTGMRGTIHDITESKQAEQRAARFSSVLESSLNEIYAFDPETLHFVEVNLGAQQNLGYSIDELRGLTPLDLKPEFTRESFATLVEPLWSGSQKVIDFITIHRRKDGTHYPVEVHLQLMKGADPVFIAIILDITERKRAEKEQLRFEAKVQETQKLESLGVLAGGIAHDFNNLLVGVLGNADLALTQLKPTSPARDYLRNIETSAQRAADLANQLLAYSGKGRFVVEPIDLSQLVDEISHLVQVSVSKKVVVKYDLAQDSLVLEADATQVRQVVLNLITNASEAIGDSDGVVSVTTGQMECDAAYLSGMLAAEDLPEGRYVFVEIADTGCGMNEETQNKIFDPFFTTKFTGRGLGLAAALGIVRGHKGAVKVYSEPGRGTTIKVLFPASVQSAPLMSHVQEATEETWRGEGAVLLVDDEKVVREVGSRMLALFGFDVLTAADGVEALEIYRDRADDIALVLLDLAMPRMGGEETFLELRRVNSDVKVLLSSGYNEQDSTSKFTGKGLAGFIQKPFRIDPLRDKIREVLGE